MKTLAHSQARLQVLLVEENPLEASRVCDTLALASTVFVVHTVTRLDAAAAHWNAHRYDAVLLGLSPCESEDLPTFVALRAIASGVPIVVLSHSSDEFLAVRAVQAGAQDYLVKGQAGTLLVRSVRYAVERARLVQARAAAEAQLRLLEASVAHLNDVVLITDADPLAPRIVYVNDAFTRQTGYTRAEALGRRTDFLQGPDTQHAALQRIDAARRAGRAERVELISYTKTGHAYWTEVDVSPLRDGAGRVTHCVAIQRDITERRAAEARQYENEKRMELALSGGSLGYWDWNPLHDSLQVSARWLEMLGLDPATTRVDTALWKSLLHPDDAPRLQSLMEGVLNSPEGTNFEITLRLRHALGHYVWILDKGAVFERLPDGQAQRVVGTHLDVSLQQEAQLHIDQAVRALEASQAQLQTLSRRILSAQETERRRVALELHDDLGQALTAVKINLMSPPRLEGRAPTALELENIRIVEDTLQQVRRIALALRPSMLDDLGLEAALRWLVKSATVNRDLVINLDCRMASQRIAPEMETACFRIVQESLTNIRRHARAKRVDIALTTDAHRLELTVRDNGLGFDLQAQANRPDGGFSLGLLGIRERASNIGGDITIETALGQGCTVRLSCALDAAPSSMP